eukprot:6641512-Pyramimonas_sp.AAC.1
MLEASWATFQCLMPEKARMQNKKQLETNQTSKNLASWGPLGGPLRARLGPPGGFVGRHGAILGVLERS